MYENFLYAFTKNLYVMKKLLDKEATRRDVIIIAVIVFLAIVILHDFIHGLIEGLKLVLVGTP